MVMVMVRVRVRVSLKLELPNDGDPWEPNYLLKPGGVSIYLSIFHYFLTSSEDFRRNSGIPSAKGG